MTKQNTKQTKQTNAAVAAADNLAAARDNAVAAFKTAAKSAASQTTAALLFVAAYYAAKKTLDVDKETKADLRAAWKDAGNTTKYESAVFYRVLKTCAKNAAYLTPRFDCAASNAAAAQAARDALLAKGVGLTSCKSAEESVETKKTDSKESVETKKTDSKESAADRLKTVLDYVASCGDSAFAAIAAAVEKRRAVAEKIAKVG